MVQCSVKKTLLLSKDSPEQFNFTWPSTYLILDPPPVLNMTLTTRKRSQRTGSLSLWFLSVSMCSRLLSLRRSPPSSAHLSRATYQLLKSLVTGKPHLKLFKVLSHCMGYFTGYQDSILCNRPTSSLPFPPPGRTRAGCIVHNAPLPSTWTESQTAVKTLPSYYVRGRQLLHFKSQ